MLKPTVSRLAIVASMVAVCGLTGCANIQVAMEFTSVNRSTQACYEALRAKPQYAALYDKLAIRSVPNDEQLADTGKMTPQMLQTAMEWYSEDQSCNNSTLETWSAYDPEMGARAAGWLTEITDIVNDVLANNPTYGYINARIKHLRERQRSDVQQVLKLQIQRKQTEESFVSDVALSVFFGAAQALAARQQVIAQSQLAYRTRVPTYKPVHIPKTVCSLNQPVRCSGGYTTRDSLGNLVDSRSSYLTTDYLGNAVNSRSSFTTRDSLGNLVNSQWNFQTLDAYGNLVWNQK